MRSCCGRGHHSRKLDAGHLEYIGGPCQRGKKRKEKERKPESPAPAQRRMKVAEMQHADVGVGMTGAGVA